LAIENSSKIFINSKLNKEKNNLIIYINFKHDTELNSLDQDIKFQIILDENFPESEPIVVCLTNFVFPTIFDNRNLLFSIINKNWNKLSRIDEIIEGIPYFILRVSENFLLDTLVYYGDYHIDKVYNINEFLLNEDLNFFRCFQYIENNKNNLTKIKIERYIIVTDVYFLFFDPLEGNKNLAKLLFWGDIRQLSNFRCNELKEEKIDTLILEWMNGKQVQVSFELTFKELSIKEFMELALSKIESITNKYKLFQDDLWKFEEANNAFNYSNKDYLLNLILTKEKMYKKKKSIILINELINLYKRIIEILSINDDPKYKEYLEKLQNVFNDKETQEKMRKENNFLYADFYNHECKTTNDTLIDKEIFKF